MERGVVLVGIRLRGISLMPYARFLEEILPYREPTRLDFGRRREEGGQKEREKESERERASVCVCVSERERETFVSRIQLYI